MASFMIVCFIPYYEKIGLTDRSLIGFVCRLSGKLYREVRRGSIGAL